MDAPSVDSEAFSSHSANLWNTDKVNHDFTGKTQCAFYRDLASDY